MENDRLYRTLGITSALICFAAAFIFNPVSFEIYIDADWRLENFAGFFIIICLEVLLFLTGLQLWQWSKPEAYSPKRMRFFKGFSITTAALIFILFLSEALVRIQYPSHAWYQFSFQQADSVLGWHTQPNDTITIPVPGKRARLPLNRYGFRGKLYDKHFRPFIVMGDELVFGWPVSRRTLFTEILNREKKRTGEVYYNFGVPGYNLLQELLLLRKWNDSLPADTVVLIFNSLNDFEDLKPDNFYFFFNRPQYQVNQKQLKISDPQWGIKDRARKFLIENSPEFHLLNLLKGEKRSYDPGSDYRQASDFFHSIISDGDSSLLINTEVILREINKELRKDDRTLVLVLAPSPAQSTGSSNREDLRFEAAFLGRIAEKYQFYFWDAGREFANSQEPSFDLSDGSLSPAGQNTMAQSLASLRKKLSSYAGTGSWKKSWILNGPQPGEEDTAEEIPDSIPHTEPVDSGSEEESEQSAIPASHP